jgi:hypothetical protein
MAKSSVKCVAIALFNNSDAFTRRLVVFIQHGSGGVICISHGALI